MLFDDLFVYCGVIEKNMRTAQLGKAAEKLLVKNDVITVADFAAVWPGMPMPSVYSRIRALQQSGRLSQVGKGKYQAIHKPVFSIPVTDKMVEVNQYLIDTCEGVALCVYQIESNLHVETARGDISKVYEQLKAHYPKVVLQKDANRFPAALDGYIIVGHLVTDSPMVTAGSLAVPSLEKQLVDSLCMKQIARLCFQKIMEVYPVNVNRLRRYACRRGVAEELSQQLSALNHERIDMFSATQKYLSGLPVIKAWVFGSFARGEETPDSDLDLLVEYDKSKQLSLLDVVRFKSGLEDIIGREVDLIENGCLKPFAVHSAEKDKYLIYER